MSLFCILQRHIERPTNKKTICSNDWLIDWYSILFINYNFWIFELTIYITHTHVYTNGYYYMNFFLLSHLGWNSNFESFDCSILFFFFFCRISKIMCDADFVVDIQSIMFVLFFLIQSFHQSKGFSVKIQRWSIIFFCYFYFEKKTEIFLSHRIIEK